MNILTRSITGFVLAAACATSGWAATKDEAIAQVNAAIAHIKKVGIEQGNKDIRETLHKSAVCVLGVSPVGENWRHETSSAEPQSVSQENP